MDLWIILIIVVLIVVGIWAVHRFMFKAPTAKEVYQEEETQPSVLPASKFIAPPKHIHTWEPVKDMNNQVKMFKCAGKGCNITKDA